MLKRDPKILYISSVCANSFIRKLFSKTKKNPGFAEQKFNRLIVEGMSQNGIICQTLSSIPITRAQSKKLFWHKKSQVEKGVRYNYIPFINFQGFKQLTQIIYLFFFLLFWKVKNKAPQFIIIDVLNYSVAPATIWFSKLLGLKTIGIVTDLPSILLNSSNSKTNVLADLKALKKITINSIEHCDGYVFLTQEMNRVINKKGVPYIVMEGLVDSGESCITYLRNNLERKEVVYAGGLKEKYGLKFLVEAFMKLKDPELSLVIYGSGPFQKLLVKFSEKDSRIIYMGVAGNEEIVKAEKKATLLVNPRFTNEEYTKYSFPSKNMEYMVSGTPLLTTCLPGMPEEYNEYVYLFDEETVDGYERKLKEVLSLPEEELRVKGERAKDWILKNKNNIKQTKRIIELVKDIRDAKK